MLESNDFSNQPDSLAKDVNALSPDNRRLVEMMTHKLLELQGAQDHSVKSSGINLFEQVPLWLNSLLSQGRSPATLSLYHHYVKKLLEAYPNPTPILIDAHLAFKSGSGVSTQTIANNIFAFKSFFSYLESMNLLSFNPAARLNSPRMPHRERKVPSASYLAQLLDSPSTSVRDRALILLLCGCGLRVSEATKIRISDLGPDLKGVTVIGKGNKQRTVPIPKHTAGAIRQHLATLTPSSIWLFPSQNPADPITPRHIAKLLKYLCARSHIPPIQPHQLRHYYASALLNKSVNLKVVASLLGHADPSVTARVYWHLLDADAKEKAIQEHNPLDEIQTARKGGSG